MAALNHVHQYIVYKIGRKAKIQAGEVMYKCKDPDCTHTAPYSMVIGKRSRCGECGLTEFILERDRLKRNNAFPYVAVPRADCCSQKKTAIEKRNIQNILDNVLGNSMQQLG